MHSDLIADMLTRIRNASRAKLQRTVIRWSRLCLKLADILKKQGFIEDYRELAGKSQGQGMIEVKLRYDDGGSPIIEGIQRHSTPGLRRYYSWNEIPKVRNGLGIMIVTTSKGVMTDSEARRAKVGGEALCAVW